jgi:hypothetical protein
MALESPLEPAQLHEGEVLEQLKRRPAGREAGTAQLLRGQPAQPRGELVAEVVKVAVEYLGA